MNTSMGAPMARYAAARRVGDFVLMSGVVAVDPATRSAVSRYEELPQAAQQALRGLGYATGQMSVDVFEAPIVAQSWFVLERIRQLAAEHGGGMADVVKLVQYFTRLADYAPYSRVRALFYPDEPPVSTVVEVSRFLPGDAVLVEVEATMYLPAASMAAQRTPAPRSTKATTSSTSASRARASSTRPPRK